jgi:acetylornithine deacetylase/succinyl-diaminopimelate desuccinylase-like protein
MKYRALLALGCAALCLPALAADPALPVAQLKEVAAKVSPERLKASIDKLVSFGTRHTLSTTTDDKRGIGAARRWVASEFAAMSAECGNCLTILQPAETVTAERIPQPAEIVDVLAVQAGTSEPERVLIISGHIDSRVTDVMNSTADAPGANDDGSGTAAVIEAARVLSHYKFPATIVYAVLTGEEQGLQGGKLLAKLAKEKNWQVEAQLNNDIIGNIEGTNGKVDANHFRLFSEGVHVNETEAEARTRRLLGGEVDSPSRNLARLVAELANATLPDFHPKLIYRADRLRRGGDQAPLQEAGYTAIRITESVENYHRQHQDLRRENGIDYGDVASGVNMPYLANMTRVNVVALADMAWAPAPLAGIKVEGAVSSDTNLSWGDSKGAGGYWVRWRDTDAAMWQNQIYVSAEHKTQLKDKVVDDYTFGVASVSPQGFVSPTVFANVR